MAGMVMDALQQAVSGRDRQPLARVARAARAERAAWADRPRPAGGRAWGTARRPDNELLVSAVKVGVATAVYGLVHSVLASQGAKAAAARLLGATHRNGLYRFFYNGQSLLTFGVLLAYLLRLPDRVLYRAPWPLALLMRLGQAGGLLYAVAAARAVGILPITGFASVSAWLKRWSTGSGDVPAEPEAQGPAPGLPGTMRVEGPFRRSRHPLNLAPVPIFWLVPTMTVKRAAFSLVATAYLVLGSKHEERRLRAAYGDAYEGYLRSGVPFYLPLPRRVVAWRARPSRPPGERYSSAPSDIKSLAEYPPAMPTSV